MSTSPVDVTAVMQDASQNDLVRRKMDMDAMRRRLGDSRTQQEKLRESCEGFESVFLQKMWEQMRKNIPKEGYLHSKDEETYQSLFDVELSKKMASAGGIGLADMLYKQLSQKLEDTGRTTTPGAYRNPLPLNPMHGPEAPAAALVQAPVEKMTEEDLYSPLEGEEEFAEQKDQEPKQQEHTLIAGALQAMRVELELGLGEEPASAAAPGAVNTGAAHTGAANTGTANAGTSHAAGSPLSPAETLLKGMHTGMPATPGTQAQAASAQASAAVQSGTPIKPSTQTSISTHAQADTPAHPGMQAGPGAQAQAAAQAASTGRATPAAQMPQAVSAAQVGQTVPAAPAANRITNPAAAEKAPFRPEITLAEERAQTQSAAPVGSGKSVGSAGTAGNAKASSGAGGTSWQGNGPVSAKPKPVSIFGRNKSSKSKAPAAPKDAQASTPPRGMAPQETLWPYEGKIISGFGWEDDPATGKRHWNSGVTMSGRPGTPVQAALDGTVIFSGPREGHGNTVVLEHQGGYRSYYGNVAAENLKVGDLIPRGANFATVGAQPSSVPGGENSAPLHFELKRGEMALNPESAIRRQS